MKISHAITTTIEGDLADVMFAKTPAIPTLGELLAVVESLAFVAETVAHMHGLERSILPHADKARAMIAALRPSTVDAERTA